MIITVTDTFNGQSVTVDSRELAATIAAWFPAAPADVTDTLHELQRRICAGIDYTEQAAYLALDVR